MVQKTVKSINNNAKYGPIYQPKMEVHTVILSMIIPQKSGPQLLWLPLVHRFGHADAVQPGGQCHLHMGREHALQAQGVGHRAAQGDTDQDVDESHGLALNGKTNRMDFGGNEWINMEVTCQFFSIVCLFWMYQIG